MPHDSFYLIPEVAEILRCEHHAVRKLINDGKLRCYRPGRKYLISVEEVERLIKESKVRNE